MKLIDRPVDVIGGKSDLEFLYAIHGLPVHMGCTSDPVDTDVVQDLNFWISRSTGVVQINPILPLDVVYSHAHGSGEIGDIWEKHHCAFADFVCLHSGSVVFEIGGGHGRLAREVCARKTVDWTILEINPPTMVPDGVNLEVGIFDGSYNLPVKVDTFVHSHVFEHMYQPAEFIRAISAKLKKGDMHVFSVPNMRVMIEKCYTNAINFEHTFYLDETVIDYLLELNGFEVVDKKYYRDDHSIFFAAKRCGTPQKVAGVDERLLTSYPMNKLLFQNFFTSIVNRVREINKALQNYEGEAVFLFGAHIWAQYLIAVGLNLDPIKFVLDNDLNKQGKRLRGSDFIVKSPTVLASEESPLVILEAGVYNSEVREQISGHINASAFFV